MNKDLKHSIFEETDCLSEQTLFDYIDKKLSPKESHAVEKHLLHCELCSDALEGLEMVKDRKRIATINTDISRKLASPAGEKDKKVVMFNYKVIVAVAASLLLLVGGAFFFTMMNKEKSMAVYVPDESVSEPPPPPAAPKVTLEENAEGEAEKPEVAKLENQVVKETPGGSENGLVENKPGSKMQSGKDDLGLAKDNSVDDRDQNIYGGLGKTHNNSAEPSTGVSSANTIPPVQLVSAEEQNNKSTNTLNDEVVVDAKKSVSGNFEFKSDSPSKTPSDGEFYKMSEDVSTKNLASSDKLERKEKSAKKAERVREKEISANESIARSAPASTSQAVEQDVGAADGAGAVVTQETTLALTTEPKYLGGPEAFEAFVKNNFDNTIFSKNQELLKQPVRIEFTVNKDGTVKNIVIIDKINKSVDEELKRVLKSMPKWQPATASGNVVSKKVTTSIKLTK